MFDPGDPTYPLQLAMETAQRIEQERRAEKQERIAALIFEDVVGADYNKADEQDKKAPLRLARQIMRICEEE